MCGSMADIQSPTAEIRRGNKKRRKKKQHENIYGHRATINKTTKTNNNAVTTKCENCRSDLVLDSLQQILLVIILLRCSHSASNRFALRANCTGKTVYTMEENTRVRPRTGSYWSVMNMCTSPAWSFCKQFPWVAKALSQSFGYGTRKSQNRDKRQKT